MPSLLVCFVKVLSRLIGINVAYTSICLYYFQAVPLAIHPINGYKFDSKNVDFDKYRSFVDKQTRFNLISHDKSLYDSCLDELKRRFEYYKNLNC